MLQCHTRLLSVSCIGEGLDIVLVGSQGGHAEALVGVPNFDGGVARRRYDVLPPAAELDVIHPVRVMLHRLKIWLLQNHAIHRKVELTKF